MPTIISPRPVLHATGEELRGTGDLSGAPAHVTRSAGAAHRLDLDKARRSGCPPVQFEFVMSWGRPGPDCAGMACDVVGPTHSRNLFGYRNYQTDREQQEQLVRWTGSRWEREWPPITNHHHDPAAGIPFWASLVGNRPHLLRDSRAQTSGALPPKIVEAKKKCDASRRTAAGMDAPGRRL